MNKLLTVVKNHNTMVGFCFKEYIMCKCDVKYSEKTKAHSAFFT